ncbi:MAG: potassium transporter TrkG [Pseudomonadota bacterium]
MLAGFRAFAAICLALAFAMLLCALIGVGQADQASVSLFFGLATILVFFAACIHLAFLDRKASLTRGISFRVLIICWFFTPILATPPFLILTDLPLHLAFFEAVSAVTTTGFTTFSSLEQVPTSIIGWRAWLQWLGGIATLVSIIVVLSPSGAGGTPLLRIGGDLRQILENRVIGVAGVYMAVTLACFTLLIASGLPVFDALALSLTTVSTGGMMPTSGSISDYSAPMAEWVLALFMLIGATSIVWHRLVATGRIGRSATVGESLTLLALAGALGFAYAVAFASAAGSSDVLAPGDALREGFLTAASLVSTTGLEARNAGATVLPLSLVLVILLVGGGMFSTAGGLKLYRIALMARHSAMELEHILYPHAVHVDHIGNLSYDADGIRAIWTALVLFMAVWAGTSIILTLGPFPPEAALVAALTAITNAGPIYSYGWAAPDIWPTLDALQPTQAIALCLTMIAGRLELVGFIAGFSIAFFKR